MADVLDSLTDEQLFAAMDRCDQAVESEILRHVVRVKADRGLRDSFWEPCRRDHINDVGDLVTTSRTYILHDDAITPLLVGTVLREKNHLLLCIVDRSGDVPVIYETTFDTRNYVMADK